MNSVFTTVISGVILLILGQFILKFVLEPVVSFKELLGEIIEFFLKNQPKIIAANCDEEMRVSIYSFASKLLAKRQAISFYKFFYYILGLPQYDGVLKAARSLNGIAGFSVKVEGISDTKRQQAVSDNIKNVEKNLGIVVSYNK